MTNESPLYLGWDLSTQQLKGIAVTSDLKVAYEAVFDFDADVTGLDVKKGVLTNEAEREVFAPVTMWLQGIDAVLQRLQDKGIDFGRIRGISGAGQRATHIRSQERHADSEIIKSMEVFTGVKRASMLYGTCMKGDRWKHNCTMRSLIPTVPTGRILVRKPSVICLIGILVTKVD